MSGASGKRVLLVVGGGVAAYKALELIRRLRERAVAVRVVMTRAAAEFVAPLSAASLSGDKVYSDLFSLTDEAEMGHIELSRAADLLVVAPATADLLAKMAHGHAGDLASTLLLATDKKILVAPAMNLRMWLAPATRRNVETLRADGIAFVGPREGEMACGEFGPGRMAEPDEIAEAVVELLAGETSLPLPTQAKPLSGRRAIVTSGPTHEPIDPVRFIANRSSGRQGHAIAQALREAGAEVVLVSGPAGLPDPAGLETVHVETALQMEAAVARALPADVFVAAAAVADWRVAAPAGHKLKKSADGADPPPLELVRNPDILAGVGLRASGRPKLVVGFAAETERLVENAQKKRAAKGCDLIVANHVGEGARVFGGARNEVSLVCAEGVEDWPELDKGELARRLVAEIARRLGPRA